MHSTPDDPSSIDPAISPVTHLTDTIPLAQLVIEGDSVYIFDFDGVVASRDDDDIYRLASIPDEVPLLSEAAKCFRIHCEGMEQRFQRHLLYQAAAWRLGLPIEPGPGFTQAMESGRRARLFILTARSGWHAVERLRTFVTSTGLNPIEIYNVGRVKKDRQVQLLCREFPSAQVFYVEDSAAHLADAAAISPGNLRLVHAAADLQPKREEVVLRRHFIETLNSALSVFDARR